MNKLPKDFNAHKYGLDVRLVNEDDAEFILKLRTNKWLARHLHPTEQDIEKQISWLREYKKREDEGRENYFIYSQNNKPIGVNRISNISDYYGLGGSWLCSPENDMKVSMATPFFGDEISFEYLNLSFIVFDVRRANTHVWKFHQSIGAVRIEESELDFYYYLSKHNYYSKRDKMLKLLNLI